MSAEDRLEDLKALTDEELLRESQRGREEAFEVLISRMAGPAVTFAHRMLGDRDEAQSLVQEAFLSVFEHLADYQYPRKVNTWIFTIIRNLCLDRLRHRRLAARPFSELAGGLQSADGGPGPREHAERRERHDRIVAAVSSLPLIYKEILILCEFQGLSYEEAAEILKAPVGTLRSRMFHALKRLRQELADLAD